MGSKTLSSVQQKSTKDIHSFMHSSLNTKKWNLMVLLKNNLVWSGYKSKEVYPKRSWKEKVDLANESYLTFLVTELLTYINI